MPMFDYTCSNCGAEFKDVLTRRKVPEGHSLACDKCGKIGSLVKTPSSANFSVKGFNEKNGYSNGGKR